MKALKLGPAILAYVILPVVLAVLWGGLTALVANGSPLVSPTAAGPPGAMKVFIPSPGDGELSIYAEGPSDAESLPLTNYDYSLDGGVTWVGVDPPVTTAELSTSIPGLNNGTTYQVAVRAVNANGAGPASAVVPVIVGSPSAPPGEVDPSDGGVEVDFDPERVDDNGDPVIAFEYSVDNGVTWVRPDPVVMSPPLLVTGLTNGVAAQVLLRAVNGRGPGAPGDYGTVIVGSPQAPTITDVIPGVTELTVKFESAYGNDSPVTNYEYRLDVDGVDPGPWVPRDPASTTSPLVLTGLTSGVGYTVNLRGVNSRGQGKADARPGTPGTPIAPTNLVATPGDKSIQIAFTPPATDNGSPVTNYAFMRLTDGGTPIIEEFDPPQAVSPVVIDELVNGTGYTVWLIPINARGDGQMSTSVFATPATVPTAPTNVTGTPGDSQVSVAFTAPADDGGSEITNYEYQLNAGVWFPFSPAVTGSPVKITGLTNGTAYSVALRAVNTAGAGASSTAISVTPVAPTPTPTPTPTATTTPTPTATATGAKTAAATVYPTTSTAYPATSVPLAATGADNLGRIIWVGAAAVAVGIVLLVLTVRRRPTIPGHHYRPTHAAGRPNSDD